MLSGLVGVAGAPQGPVQPLTGPVAGEHPTRAVGAVRGRCQPDHDHRCRRIAEPGHRSAPVLVVAGRRPAWSTATSSRQATSRGQAPTRDDLVARAATSESISAGYGYLGLPSRAGDPSPRSGLAAPNGTDAPNAPSRSPPPPTTVLLVRHGQTPSTGTTLPGRARACTWPTRGAGQAEAAAARIAKLDKVTAVYASPLERTRETAAPIAKALGPARAGRAGPARVRLRRVDRAGRSRSWPALPEWRTVQRYPERLPLPRRRVVHRDADRG